jgi:Domain of unknown function (DUF1833)
MATDKLLTVRASAPARQDILRTLTLEHPLWPAPYYLTTWPTPYSATLETGATVTFMPFPFAVVLPTVDGAGQQNMQVTLTNADQAISDAVQLAHTDPTQRIVCTYREYLSDELGAPQSAPLRLSFESIQITEESVTGVAGRSDVLNRRFPGVWYDVQHFPGLDR